MPILFREHQLPGIRVQRNVSRMGIKQIILQCEDAKSVAELRLIRPLLQLGPAWSDTRQKKLLGKKILGLRHPYSKQ